MGDKCGKRAFEAISITEYNIPYTQFPTFVHEWRTPLFRFVITFLLFMHIFIILYYPMYRFQNLLSKSERNF